MTGEPAYVLRDATVDDAESIVEILNESILAGDATTQEKPRTAAEIRELIAVFGRREAILVLESGQEVLGWGIIKRYSDRPGYRFSCETSVYLRRVLMGKGYGSYLKRAMIERCRDFGYHHLVARIFADNRRSIEYNLKLGYEMVGIQKEIGYTDGVWRDVAILQLVLRGVPSDAPEEHG